jgi:hypothetical protein
MIKTYSNLKNKGKSNMNKQTFEELIKFFESKNMSDVARGLKSDMKALTTLPSKS